MFDLKRPCTNCPFKKGNGSKFMLGPDRLQEIHGSTAFQCHKTVHYHDDGENYDQGNKPAQCAGLMAVLHREGTPNQIMQVAGRLSDFDPKALDPRAEAYGTWDDVKRAHLGELP